MNTTKTVKISSNDFGLLATENLTRGITIRFTATGSSMHPSIMDGDILSVAPADIQKLKRGDIILYRINGTNNLIAHRIIFIKNNASDKIMYTRGDALGGNFEQVASNDILGRIFKVEHNGDIQTVGKAGDRLKGILRAIRQSLRHKYLKLFRENNSK
jgi:signal peptidase I